MKKLSAILLLALGCMPTFIWAADDMRAVTEDGRKVLLAPDGKWHFDQSARPVSSVPSSVEATSPYQTAVKKFSVAFNTEDWVMMPKRDGESGNKRMFQHKRLPIYGMVLADEMPATNEAMKSLIFYNANTAGAETKALVDQTRKLGGHQIGELRMTAVMKGMEFMFSTYYYADDDGNIQVSCYTAQSLFHKYLADCEKFLNGLTFK